MKNTARQAHIHDLAIIGLGPVGLEAASASNARGLDVIGFEATKVGGHVDQWGQVRLFSPFELNAGPAGEQVLVNAAKILPEPGEIMTGATFLNNYLRPLADQLSCSMDLLEGVRVLAVGRQGWLKNEGIASSTRATQPFRILVEENGNEREVLARSVFDCSGTYGRPNWAGGSGIPARGERQMRNKIEYHVPDPTHRNRAQFESSRTLLIGGGHSAATTALALAELAGEEPSTSFVWATRGGGGTKLQPLTNDPLRERAKLVDQIRDLRTNLPDGSEWLTQTQLVAVWAEGQGIGVELTVNGSIRRDRFDHIVANVGYEPDDTIYRQLQIHECYASRGPMNLAAALLAASGDGPADCLSHDRSGKDTIQNPESGFFILGAKSFGKNSSFLMRTGYEQVSAALSLIVLGLHSTK